MSKKSEKNLIVGLDIGTSKVLAVIAELMPGEQFEIIGMGIQPARGGLKKGVVVNIDATVLAIQKALEEAERMAGCTVPSVYAGIAGGHIRSFNSHGIVAIRDQEVSADDIERVLEAAKAVAIGADQKILHVLTQEFSVDNQLGIREPIGMSGVRLETQVHMVTGSVTAAQNIIKSVRRCGLEVDDIILQQLAASEAILSEDERQLGVCLIDIGGGTSDVAVYHEGAIRHSWAVSVAGDQVTNDIAVAFRTPSYQAELIKVRDGCAKVELVAQDESFELPSVGDKGMRQLPRRALAEVIEARYGELFKLIKNELHRSGYGDMLSTGIVLTGGSAKMDGVVALAEDIFQLPVRIGIPGEVSGLTDVMRDPIYSAGVGLLLWAYQNQQQRRQDWQKQQGIKGMLGRFKSWLQGNL